MLLEELQNSETVKKINLALATGRTNTEKVQGVLEALYDEFDEEIILTRCDLCGELVINDQDLDNHYQHCVEFKQSGDEQKSHEDHVNAHRPEVLG